MGVAHDVSWVPWVTVKRLVVDGDDGVGAGAAGVSPTGQTVVNKSTTSVTTTTCCSVAGQLRTCTAQLVIVYTVVDDTVSVCSSLEVVLT
jgi:hypothetical protein